MSKPKKKIKPPKLSLKTEADYIKVFNDLGRVLGGHDPKITSDDVWLYDERVSVRISLSKLGTATLDLNRREFDKSVVKMIHLVMSKMKGAHA